MSKQGIPRWKFCVECKTPMLKAEWMTGDYCWGCRVVLGRNWQDQFADEEGHRNVQYILCEHCRGDGWIIEREKEDGDE